MVKKMRLALSAVLVACLLLIAGCGSNNSATQGTNNPQPGSQTSSAVQNNGQGTNNGKGNAQTTPNRPGAPGANGGNRLQDIAQVLGMTVDGVRSQMQQGKSLADLIQEKGLNKDQVEQKLLDLEKARLDAAVKAGRMSQQQADQMLANMQKRGLDAWNWTSRNPQSTGGNGGSHQQQSK